MIFVSFLTFPNLTLIAGNVSSSVLSPACRQAGKEEFNLVMLFRKYRVFFSFASANIY